MPGTANYVVQIGKEEIKFEGPDNLTDQQIEYLADKELRNAHPGKVFKPSHWIGPEPSDTKPGRDPSDSSGIGAFLRGSTRDSTFNWGDEISALGNAGIPGLAELDNAFGATTQGQKGPLDGGNFWDRVKANQASLKDQYAADDEMHPVAGAAGKIAGVVSSLPRAGAAVAARIPEALAARIAEKAAARPLLTAATAGTAGGAVSGAGAGENGTRAQSAATGALTGAALGNATHVAGELAPWLARNGRILLNKGADSEAIRQIVQALKRDGHDVSSPSGVAKLKAALQDFTGKPVSLADIGGATRARAGVGLRSPSDVQQASMDAVRSRQAGQGQRLAGDVRATVAPRTDVHTLDEELVKQRAEDATRLRDAALFEDAPTPAAAPQHVVSFNTNDEAGVMRTLGMGEGVDDTFSRQMVPAVDGAVPATGRTSRIVDDEMLQQLARLPFAQRALTHALDLSESERALLASQGKSIDHLPDLHRGSDLDMRTFDTLKRYLDNEVNMLYKRGAGNTYSMAEAGQVKDLRNAIRDRLRVAVPEYGTYLDSYKGSSEMIDSLAAGQSYDKLPPELISAGQAQRSTAGQELFRVGTARNLLDTIRETKDTGNAASRILNSPEARDQLAATGVAPANAARLNKSVAQERQLNLLSQEMSGSQTNQRALATADANAGADVAVPFNPGSPLGWAGMIGRKIINHGSSTRNAAVNEALLPQMLETNPAAIDAVIARLEQSGNMAAAKLLRKQAANRRRAAMGGSLIGSPVSLQNEEQ